jgi:two-component system phosphate regulon sensor histidine kinase PhoR
MILERTSFIESVLGPRMQTIAQDKFVITAFDRRTNSAVYSTTTINADSRFSADGIESLSGEGLQKKTLWLLPGYYLGISLKEATLDDLVNDRVLTSLVLLLLLIVVLVFGMIFLYRNIRREMNLSQAKSEFVSNVSHEIRTPLSLISMYAETLEMDRVPENRKREYYSIIAKETARLSRIVNRILNFSRMDANKKKYEFSPVQINDVCAQIMDSYILHLQDQGFTHNITMQENLPVVMGDRDAISEAVINLLDNAMKYSLEKKDIQLRTFTERQTVIVEVRDRGMGIARTHHHAIFEQFFRAPSGDVHTTKGSGLGLTLVKKTMEAHHGRVTVQSSPGQGSTFRLIFPGVKTPVSI